MPYARRTYRRRYARRPTTRRPRYRRKTGYTKRVPVRTRTATRINAKKIRRLQTRVIGHLQKGYHICKVPNLPTPGGFVWKPAEPFMIALNDFYTQTTGPTGGAGAIYYPRYFGAPPNVTMGSSILDRWSDYKPGENFGFSQQYWQWKDVQNCQPDVTGYLPVFSDIRVCINRERCTPDQGDMWVRVDFVRAKRTFIPNNSVVDPKIYNLPTALGAFANMAAPLYNQGRNSYNPALWSVKTRWIKLPAVQYPSQNIMNAFHIRTRFPKQFLKLNNNVTAAGVSEEFWTLVPARTMRWCVFSLSAEPVNGDNTVPSVSLTRHVSYRDNYGNGM